MPAYVRSFFVAFLCLFLCLGLQACASDSLSPFLAGHFPSDSRKHKKAAEFIEEGHRLMQEQKYEKALRAFSRAAIEQKEMSAEILSGMGSAHLALGRLHEAETLLRRATKREDAYAEIWNNLGVVLMEQNKPVQATHVFRTAFGLSNGESTIIRDNLRMALAKSEKPVKDSVENNNYKLERRGGSDYLLRRTSINDG